MTDANFLQDYGTDSFGAPSIVAKLTFELMTAIGVFLNSDSVRAGCPAPHNHTSRSESQAHEADKFFLTKSHNLKPAISALNSCSSRSI